jgi:hypothetical protein
MTRIMDLKMNVIAQVVLPPSYVYFQYSLAPLHFINFLWHLLPLSSLFH